MAAPDLRKAWDTATGLPPGKEEEISFIKEMIAHPASGYGLLGAVAAGAAMSIPLGLGFAVIPILAYAGAEAIAALFIPSSPVFQEKIRRKKRLERREQIRAFLMQKIEEKAPFQGDTSRWANDFLNYVTAYTRMLQRRDALAKTATGGEGRLSPYDMERIDEVTVDFLRLFYTRIQTRERMFSSRNADIERQVKDLGQQIQDGNNSVDRKRLEKAKADLERVLAQRARLPARDAATAAQLTTMIETFEELYNRVTTDPATVSDFLTEATSRMSIEEELSVSVEDELSPEALKRAQARMQAQGR